MRSILVPVEDHDDAAVVLATANRLAERFGATIDAIALRPMQFQVVGAEPIVAVTFPSGEPSDDETMAGARKRFDAFASASPPAGTVRLRWRGGEPIDDNGLGSLGRVYDITAVGRPNATGSGPRMATFDSGRPILIAPPVAPAVIGDNVVISWNGSMEAARTIAFSLPVILGAKQVTVLTVEGSTVPAPSGADVVAHLASHGVTARELTVAADSRKPGLAILEEARKLGADVLVKGAYTQSRLRQMIFGGATSQILASAELPVLMAN